MEIWLSKISFPFVSTPDLKPCHTVTKIAIVSVPLSGLIDKTAPSATNLPSTSSTMTPSTSSTTTSQINFIHEYDISIYREKAKSKTDSEIGVLIKICSNLIKHILSRQQMVISLVMLFA